MKREYSHHKEMMDDRMVNETHQGGIERVKQRKGDMPVGQPGKMNNSPSEKANWTRPNKANTPRGA